MIDLKNNSAEKFVKPVDAFITFEEEDGKIIAEMTEETLEDHPKFLGEYLHMAEAAEPTNIIWENRHYDNTHYAKANLRVFITVAALLALSFLTIYLFKSNAIAQASKYPPIKARDVISLYQTNETDNSKM